MCENVTNLCINWSYTSSWQRQRERERETNHMGGWFASSQGLFYTLSPWSGWVAADSRKPAEVMQNRKVLCPFEPHSSILEATKWISTRHLHITPMGKLQTVLRFNCLCLDSYQIQTTKWRDWRPWRGGREGAEGNPGTDSSCLETLLKPRDPGKLTFFLLCESLHRAGAGTRSFLQPRVLWSGSGGVQWLSYDWPRHLWGQKRLYRNLPPQQHRATYYYSNSRNKEIEVLQD